MKYNNLIFTVLAIAICMSLLSYEFIPAFADTTITIITPTGGALSSASDCTDITSGNGIIWHPCNNIIYAISETTNAVLANISVTVGTSDSLLASVTGTSLYLRAGGTNDIRKYTYSGSTISLSGIYTPPCTLGAELQYDELGYLWSVCGTQDQILRVNPNTLSTEFVSQALDDNVGIDCDTPTRVSYSASDGIGIIRCSVAPQGIVSFSIASPTSANLLDDVLNANIGNNNVFVHERYNRIIAVDSTELEVYSYTSGGIISAQEKVITATYDGCGIEPYITADVMTVCIDDSGTNVLIYGFVSNSTQVFQLLNTVQAMDNTNGDKTLGFDIQDRTWFIDSNTNDQRYIKISGLAPTSGTPDPPTPPPPSTGIDCTLPENANILTCRLGGDGSLVGAGNFIVGNVNGTTGLTPIICSTGIVDCIANPDMKTNGVGYLLVTIALGVIIGVLWVASRGDLNSIPTFIWFVATLAVVGAFTLMDLIDATFLVITAIIVVALAAAKVRGLFGGEFR